MNSPTIKVALVVIWLGAFAIVACAQPDELPRPRRLDDETCVKFSSPDFERLLSQLKAEREALTTDWKSLSKKALAGQTFSDKDDRHLEKQLKDVLKRLKDEKTKPGKNPVFDPPLPAKKDDAPPPEITKKDEQTRTAPDIIFVADSGSSGTMDPLLLAQALFRAEQYDEALTAFRKIDLKGKKAEERAPVQLLMATCLQRVGKNDEAATLLRDVANTRGDERMAGYAQWQLEMARWQRDVHDRLKDIRQRRQALEKRP